MNAKTTKRLLNTMGRVGTSSINKALNDAGQPAFSVHWAQHKDKPVAEYPALNKQLIQRIKHGGPSGKPLSVIIPIREPMARNIAAFFRTLVENKENDNYGFTLDTLKMVSTNHLQSLFMKYYNISFKELIGFVLIYVLIYFNNFYLFAYLVQVIII